VARSVVRNVGVTLSLIAAVALLSAESCLDGTSTTEPQKPLDCQKGYYESNGECVLRPDVITVEITNPTGGVCPRFTPNPVALRVGQDVRWHNNTGSQVVVRSQQTPLVTAPPNGYSGIISFSTAGRLPYAASSCNVAGSTTYEILVTAG
jgi:hypothetical protein